MSEAYFYTPPHYKLQEKVIPNTPIMDEIEQLVDQAFGDDYERDIQMLDTQRHLAENCGCGACLKGYELLMEQVAMRYVNNSGDK